ncbi:hypothetical protein HPB50_026050 [Hyalomma asiaticum]|uniref:Uncharacterized protein n=1 Tax=Hyalomma asiaticum TaxID=266040 RepID=A0ACB7TRC3_HYAAI|nr:hypothetical protein HPB50_026050 [Hyalomma asiaticum]
MLAAGAGATELRKVAIKRGAPAAAHLCRSVTGYTRPAGAWPRPRSSRDRAAAKVRKTGTAESAPPRRREAVGVEPVERSVNKADAARAQGRARQDRGKLRRRGGFR